MSNSASKLKTLSFWLIASALIAALFLLARQMPHLQIFPEDWNLGWRDPINDFKRWVVINRTTHGIFLYFFEPLSAVLDFIIRRAEDFLLWLPWPIIMLGFFLSANQISGLRLGLLVSACLLLMGLFGLWEESMETLALMSISVFISLLIGIPLGIWSAQNDRVDQLLRPVLDAMQTIPIFVYLIPVLLFFGVARVPSAIATIVYALPPAIRLTNLGIRGVSADLLEAADSFGSTAKQRLRKVQIPVAMPSILTGVNQTIMMALSIVVLAALIGSGGLGDVVLKSLRRLRVGSALEAGLAIVVLAILLDRFSAALGQRSIATSQRQFQGFRLFPPSWQANSVAQAVERQIEVVYRRSGQFNAWLKKRLPQRLQQDWLSITLVCAVLAIPLLILGVDSFPRDWNIGISGPVDGLVDWMRVNLYNIGDSGIGTGPFRDFLIVRIFLPLTNFLTNVVPWTVMVLLATLIAFRSGNLRLTVGVIFMLVFIGLIGMWEFAMDTLGQTLIAVVLCILIGIPLGILSSRNDALDKLLRPFLDLLQTIPIFVYLVPVIMLFGTGSVAGLIASVVYALAPVVRLTNLGIRKVDETVKESATAFGSTAWQKLVKVEVPLALPEIMLGINQTTMMVLAMVIIAGLVGATGLGLEVIQGFANDNLGRSVEAGTAMVMLAMVIDRTTQAWADKLSQAANLQH